MNKPGIRSSDSMNSDIQWFRKTMVPFYSSENPYPHKANKWIILNMGSIYWSHALLLIVPHLYPVQFSTPKLAKRLTESATSPIRALPFWNFWRYVTFWIFLQRTQMDNAQSCSQILVTLAKHHVLAFQDKLQKAHLNHRRRGRALGRRAPRRSDHGRWRCCSGCRYPSKTSPPPTPPAARTRRHRRSSPTRPTRTGAIRRTRPEEAGFRERRDGKALSGEEGPRSDHRQRRPRAREWPRRGGDWRARDVNLPLFFFRFKVTAALFEYDLTGNKICALRSCAHDVSKISQLRFCAHQIARQYSIFTTKKRGKI
jgi:hypothetical protein